MTDDKQIKELHEVYHNVEDNSYSLLKARIKELEHEVKTLEKIVQPLNYTIFGLREENKKLCSIIETINETYLKGNCDYLNSFIGTMSKQQEIIKEMVKEVLENA